MAIEEAAQLTKLIHWFIAHCPDWDFERQLMAAFEKDKTLSKKYCGKPRSMDLATLSLPRL